MIFSAKHPLYAILRRELLTSLRLRRSFLFLLAMTLAVILVVWRMWPEEGMTIQNMAQQSKTILLLTSLTPFLGCIVLVPALGAMSILSERERETIDLLRLTLASPSTIVAAKALTAAGFYLLLLVATLPAYAAVLFAAGVDWIQVGMTMALLVMTAFWCALIGIAWSAGLRRPVVAFIASYVTVAAIVGGPRYIVTGANVVASGFVPGRTALSGTDILSPLRALVNLQTGFARPDQVILTLGLQGIVCFICFVLAVFLLRRPEPHRQVTSAKPIDDASVLRERRRRFPFYLIDPLRRRPAIEDGRNPMFVRELRAGLTQRGTVYVRVFYVVGIVSMVAALFISVSSHLAGSVPPWMAFQVALLAVAAPLLTANAFTKEYELGNFDMLRMTFLTPREIVWGKTLAAWTSLSPVLAAIVLASVPMLLLEWTLLSIIVCGWITLFVSAALAVSLGMISSLITRRTAMALSCALFLNVLFFGGISGILWLIAVPEYGSYDRGLPVGPVAMLSPVFAYLQDFMPGYSMYYSPYWPNQQTAGGFVWLRSQVLFTGLSAVLFWSTVLYFRAYRMREV